MAADECLHIGGSERVDMRQNPLVAPPHQLISSKRRRVISSKRKGRPDKRPAGMPHPGTRGDVIYREGAGGYAGPCPMVTPERMVAPRPIQMSDPVSTGALLAGWLSLWRPPALI